MKLTKLLMFTISYPYGNGESFVSTELNYLSKSFHDIEIVPSYYEKNRANRNPDLNVNLDYAKKRWGYFRPITLLYNCVIALARYNWLKDAFYILENKDKWANIKELARALYRAQLFENFLQKKTLKNKKNFDIIYFYWMVPEIMGALSFRKRSNTNVKIIARGHAGDIYEDRRKGEYFGLRRNIALDIDAIYCISDHGKLHLKRKYFSLQNKCHTARLGVGDPGFLNPQPKGDILSIVSCSFVIDSKRINLIIDAIDSILTSHPSIKIKWTHIGDGELYEEIRNYAFKKLNNRADVVFTGYLTGPEIMSLYKNESFDVFINVSSTEGLPVTLMEASSVGLPLIATDVGGSSEIVNFENGILIPANASIETIASSLQQFQDKRWAFPLRNKSKLYWNKNFNAEINYNIFSIKLENLLELDN